MSSIKYFKGLLNINGLEAALPQNIPSEILDVMKIETQKLDINSRRIKASCLLVGAIGLTHKKVPSYEVGQTIKIKNKKVLNNFYIYVTQIHAEILVREGRAILSSSSVVDINDIFLDSKPLSFDYLDPDL
ncbi:MAG: hypothetical protein DRG78_01735 [Epsilonproteobacteria bacterium]|nr:MAG: hypothetical protein DRG78_01735 [Campylobacterota bacterium]